MDKELKAKLLEAADLALKLWQTDMAKAILAANAEIDRLHQVLYEQGQRTARVSQAMLTVLPLLRRIEEPSEEMFAAMCLGRTPFIHRRKADKSGYEVVRMDSADWRSGVSEKQTVVFDGGDEESLTFYHRVTFRWRYNEMLCVANSQPIHNQEQPA
jgi:hypothetical protein